LFVKHGVFEIFLITPINNNSSNTHSRDTKNTKEFRLNKTTMIQIVNKQIDTQTIKSITEIVDKLLAVMVQALQNNERVNFAGLMIDTVFVKSKSGVMFKNKIPFTTQDKYVPRVKIGKSLKAKVAQNGKK